MKRAIAFFLSAFMTFSGITAINAQTNEIQEQNTAVELAASVVPAFPGAEGGGKYATGGRGGKVYYVTNLNDSGAGSFRDAVSGSNRIVLFKVGGTIELKSDVVVKGNVTIAGQTAPGGQGITLKNYKLGMGGSNIIARFISSRPGEIGKENDGWGGSDGSNSIVDHCSIGWANDEMWGLYSNNDYNTVQYSVIGPSNSWSVHDKGLHGFGIMFGKSNVTWHHNLVPHNISRNFRGKVEGTSTAEFANNVIYDWGYQTGYGTMGHINYVGNYLKAGKSTTGGYHFMSIPNSGSSPWKYKVYLDGNKLEKQDGSIFINATKDENWSKGISLGSGPLNAQDDANGKKTPYTRDMLENSKPYTITVNGNDATYSTHAESADEAYENVLNYCGAAISADKRTPIDAQVVQETRTGTGSLTGARPKSAASAAIQADIEKYSIACDTAYEYPKTYTDAYTDSDGDGMEDSWEVARGLNPFSKYDENGKEENKQDYCGLGYTNIEYFINDLTVDAFPEGVVTVSPATNSKITVDQTAPVVEGESYRSIQAAIDYLKTKDNISNAVVTVNSGTYNENVTASFSGITIKAADSAAVTVSSITVPKGVNDTVISGMTVNTVTSNGDKTVVENCKTDTKIDVAEGSRIYINNSEVLCAASIKGNAVIDKSNVSAAAENSGVLLLNNCTVKSDKIVDAKSADAETYFYNNTFSGSLEGESRVANTVNSLIVECNSKGVSSYASSETVLENIEFLLKYLPFNVLKGADSWNPAGFSETTPQEDLKAIADKLSVTGSIISKELALDTSVDNASVKWSCNVDGILSGNTIVPGEYGSGVKEAVLTAVVSAEGLNDEVRTFNILVGTMTDKDSVFDFEDTAVGETPVYFNVTPDRYRKDGEMRSLFEDKIDWGVADNIKGVTQENGKFFCVDQTKLTDLEQSVESGQGIHDFVYDFGDQGESVIEAGYDFYVEDISDTGHFEVYTKSATNKTISSMRVTNKSENYGISAYKDSSKSEDMTTENADGKWYSVKVIVDSRGVSKGVTPTIDYFVIDSDGKTVASLKGCTPRTAFDSAVPENSIPGKLVFRPNRKLDVCKFYVDNIYMKNVSELVQNELDDIEVKDVYNAADGDKLPKYGAYEDEIKWIVTDGNTKYINADGTINYSMVKEDTIKIKPSVGTEYVSLDGKVYTIKIVGTAAQNPEYTDTRFYNDTEEFSNWNAQKGFSDVVVKNDTSEVAGNATAKMKLTNKALFRSSNDAISTGKAMFKADFLYDTAGTRTFRIYLENNSTAASNGEATEDFASANIIYHLMNDSSGRILVVTTDDPSAQSVNDESTVLCTGEANKWYNVEVTVDLDNKTADTKLYAYGTYGDESTLTLVKELTTDLITKSVTQIKQVRLVRTSAGNVYFDNVSMSKIEEQPDEPIAVGDVNGDGKFTSLDAALLLKKVLRNDTVLGIENKVEDINDIIDVDNNGMVTAADVVMVIKKVNDPNYVFPREKEL